MINLSDYKNYFKENYKFLLKMKNKWRLLFSSFDDCITILQLIDDQISRKEKLTTDLETIFDIAYNYLFEQLEFVKLIYSRYLSQDDELLSKYEKIITYSIYLYDVEDTLKEKNKYGTEEEKVLSTVQKEIESILEHKENYTDLTLDKFNDVIDPVLGDKRVYSSLEIFGMIRDEIKIE